MKASVEKLRWGLAAGAIVLLLAVLVSLGYGRYRQTKKWIETIKRLNLHGAHETLGFTYSSSPKDRTSYKVHAKRVVQHGDGTWSLYDVDVTLYSKTSSDVDHIRASDIEYDQNSGVAKAIGDVHMDFEAPGALKNSKVPAAKDAATEDTNIIHVETSGVVYVKKLDVAATDQPIEFRYSGMRCTARGAEFHSGDSQLFLQSDVVMDGTLKNDPFTLHATSAALDRNANIITLQHPVAQSRGRTAAASHAIAHLRKDGSLEDASADGGVTMDNGTRHLAAATYSGTFGTTSSPLTAKLTGGVTMNDSDTHRPVHGKAAEVNATFTPTGEAQQVIATGSAQLIETIKTAAQPDTPRELRGDRITADYAPVPGSKHKSQLREIRVNGSAFASGISAADKKTGAKTTQLTADELRAAVIPTTNNKLQVQQVIGTGHTRFTQTAAQGAQQISTGDELTANFTAGRDGALEISTATQTGHVTLHSLAATKPNTPAPEPADATAARATYDSDSAKFALAGSVHFQQGAFDLTAANVAVNQLTGDAEATGNIVATTTSAPKTPNATPPQPTHITADRATLLHAAQLAEFFGTARPARLWQSASEVQAASLLFDQKKKSIAARPDTNGKIHAVFARAARPGEAKPGPTRSSDKAAQSVIRVTASTMDYDDIHREATFTGGVRMEGTTAQAQSQRAVVFLDPPAQPTTAPTKTPELGGQLRRVVLTDSVHLSSPGRTGTGEMLVYNAADANYTLTGSSAHPPHIVDARQGSITGATLVFHDEGTGAADSTIIVDGLETSGKQGRVRTEVEVKNK